MQHNRVSRYRDHDSSYSEQDWEQSLTSFLVDPHPIGDLDVWAENKEDGHLIIDIRKKSTSGRAVRRPAMRLDLSDNPPPLFFFSFFLFYGALMAAHTQEQVLPLC